MKFIYPSQKNLVKKKKNIQELKIYFVREKENING